MDFAESGAAVDSELSMAERRKLARFEVSAPVRLLLGSGDTQQHYETRLRNLSAGGAYIYANDPRLTIGDEVDVEISVTVDARQHLDDLPQQVLMTGRGTVTRRDSTGLGLEFTGQLSFG